MYRIYYINRIAFKISKQLASYTPEMKTKKQKINNSASKKQNKSLDPMAPLGKQFQLLYRTCDKLPSSEQYQSVFFMKRKKISCEEQAPVQQKKAKKKKQSIKKKKFEEKIKVDEIGQTLFKKSQSLCATKSTMPSTLGLFKKSTFADTFKQKINLDKSALKKMNNLSNSNSSRYLTSKYTQKQKSPSKKFTSPSGKRLSKSPSKPLISSDNKISDKSIKSNKKLKSKFSKRISDKVSQLPTETTSNWKKSKNITKNEDFKQNVDQNFNQYVFIDGEYVQVQDPDCQALTEKITKYFGIGAPQVQPTYQSIHIRDDHGSNQFIDGFQANIIGLERKSSISHLRQSREQICLTEQSLTQTQKAEAEAQVLQKIIYIQRFWRAYIQRKTIEQCNNIKHFPSKAESQQSISDRASRNDQEQEDEDEDQNQNEFKDTLQQNKVNQCNSKSQKSLKQFIEMRQNLMLSHMQSEKDILNKMLELKKIDAGKYTQSLMQVESNFQTEMLEINKLKQKMVIQSERMEQLKIKLKQKSEIITKLEKLPANIVLEHFIEKPTKSHPKNSQSMQIIQSQFHRQKSNGYHYSELSEQAETETKHVSYRKSHPAPQSSTKSPIHVAETEKEEFQPSDQEADEDNQEQGSDMLSDAEKLSQLFQGFADHQIAQNQIQKRYAGQLGVGFQNSGGKQGSISTSVLSIHTFMTNFLKFYQYFYKDEFLKLINLPYGYNQKTRMKILQNYTSESWQTNNPLENEDDQTFFRIQQIIGQQIIEDFHEHNYQLPDNIDDNIKALIYFQKIHQKAIIHCFNQCLNCFRPYFFINGAPYIWNYSEKALTFYYIAQENIQEVFQKTQYKVLKIASSLCGAIVESLMAKPDTIKGMSLEQKLGKYRESVNPLLLENREQKLNKVEKQQIEEYNFRWEYFEEDKTSVLFNVAEAIYLELLLQIVQYQPLGNLSEDVSHYSSNSSETVISDKNQNNSHQSSASSSNNRIQATNEISVKHNKIAQHQNENQQGSANSEQQEPQIQKQNEENEGEDEEDEDEQEQQVQIQPLSFQRLQNWGRIAENKEQDQQEGEGDEQSQQKDEKYEQVQNSERKKRYYRQQYEKSEENEEEDQQNSQEQQEVHDGSEQRSQEQENSYENQEDQFEQQDEEEHAK